MRWLIPILLFLPTLAYTVPTENVVIGKVVKVTDGDTITILTADNKQERIRLWGIDAPEQRGAQPFWRASKDQLASMVADKTVTVTWDNRDSYGRILGSSKLRFRSPGSPRGSGHFFAGWRQSGGPNGRSLRSWR